MTRSINDLNITEDEEEFPFVDKIDVANSTVTYLGRAFTGSATSSAVWKIQRISVSGTITTIENADGNVQFDNIWDNRASLSYS